MDNLSIPPDEWPVFYPAFSRQHQGWLVHVSRLQTERLDDGAPPGGRVDLYAGYRPLREVRAERNDRYSEVMVTVGEGTDETSFLIEDVSALYARRAGDAHQGLRIDSADGSTTLVEFRTAAEPGQTDGLPAEET